MASYRIGLAAEVLGVSADTVRRWADSGRLPTTRTSAGHRLVDGIALAELAATLGAAQGRESAIVAGQSARNRLPGIVTKVVKDHVAAQVDLQAGPHRIVSLMTAEAADELDLAPGVLVIASVKATNVVVELPA